MRVFDLHCDTLTVCKRKGWSLDGDKTALRLSDAANFDHYIQLCAVFVPDDVRGRQAQNFFSSHHAYYRRQLDELAGDLFDIAAPGDLARAAGPETAGKLCSILAVEGGAVLGGDLDKIDELANAGVRSLTLTWNGANELAGGVGDGGGLTELGREAVALMEERGIAVDVSHLSDKSFYDVAETAKLPFIATHSCARAVCPHRRNLTDEMFQIIAGQGGIVGLNYCRDFIAPPGEPADLGAMVRHIEHFLMLGGEDAVALGSDYDGADMDPCIDRAPKQADLYRALLAEGISEEQADKLFFLNAYRYFEKLLAGDF